MPDPVRLDLQYDGTDFHGWQRMPGVVTIQGELERALSTILRTPITCTAAGRTDAGVHADGQVVSFELGRTLSALEARKIFRGANALLPDGIAAAAVTSEMAGFDARRSAIGKRYVYRIHNAPQRPVFTRRTRWHLPLPLDVEAMQRAAYCLIGEHDFDAFRAAGCQSAHARRYLWRARIERHGDDVSVELRGNAFVRSQVRVTVGTLVEVGLGKRSERNVLDVLEGRDRTKAGITAPPQGLTLARVYYARDVAEADIPDGASWPGFRR